MYRRYKAKHYNGKVKVNSFSKMTLVIVLLVLFALNSLSGILSYLTSTASITNAFTIADL